MRCVFHRLVSSVLSDSSKATESLSDPTPSLQLPRLKRLYADLHVALSPLLPKDHIVMVTLSSPLSPTSAPLLSALSHLREAITSLRERCAPVRDSQLDQLLQSLDITPPASSTKDLAKLVVETMKSILDFAEIMKDDLSQFVVGSMSEKQLRKVVMEQATASERKLVLQLWGLEKIRQRWRDWLPSLSSCAADGSAKSRWILQLVNSVGSSVPVSCPLPTKAPVDRDVNDGDAPQRNELPPPLFMSTPSILYTQNFLQALVIAASLQSLVPRSTTQLPADQTSFVGRIWALLKAEIDDEPGSGDTKLINLADEVIQAHRSIAGSSHTEESEQRLRDAVERILRTQDPVFSLLQKRLLTALSSKLAETSPPQVSTSNIPEHLQSGRSRGPPMRLDLSSDAGDDVNDLPVDKIYVKGFEDPVLVKAVGLAVTQMRRCIRWTTLVWGDVVEG